MLHKRLKRIELLLLGIFMVLVINLFISFSSNTSTNESEQVINKELPKELTRDNLDKTVFVIKSSFNNQKWMDIYALFGDFAKSQLQSEDVSASFNKLRNATGDIATYTYSHYEYGGFNENADWFNIYYKCRFDNGRGTIKVSTRTVELSTEIVGIVINLDEL